MMTRTDAHRPSVLQPGKYELSYSIDHGSPNEPMTVPDQRVAAMVRANLDDATGRGTRQCHVCGAHLRYAVAWTYVPTGRYIVTGEECAATIELSQAERASHMVTQLKLAAKERRELAQAAVRVAEAEAADPEQAAAGRYLRATADLHRPCGCFLCDVANRYARNGYLSVRQVAAVLSSVGRDRDRAHAEALAELAPPEVVAPIAEGWVTVEGEIVAIKSQPGYAYNTTDLKMLVKTTGNYKLWGTLPRALYDADKGSRVRFVAVVEAKETDFGYFSRPSKAEVL